MSSAPDGYLLGAQDWILGLSLIRLTGVMRAMGVVVMVLLRVRIRTVLEARSLGIQHVVLILIGVVGAAGLLLATLHGAEAAIWAAAYLWLGALNSPIDAMIYFVDSMTTRGASGLMLQRNWQLIGAHASVRYQHGLHVRDDAGVLANVHDPLSLTPRAFTSFRRLRYDVTFQLREYPHILLTAPNWMRTM